MGSEYPSGAMRVRRAVLSLAVGVVDSSAALAGAGVQDGDMLAVTAIALVAGAAGAGVAVALARRR